MPTIDLSANIKSLGADLLNGLRSDLLSHVTDPAEIDLISRNTAKLAASAVAMVGASPEVLAQATEDYNTAMTVLLSLASAAVEDAETARQEAMAKLQTFVQSFLAGVLQKAILAIPLMAV